ncbi:hypothetical protein DNTS_033510 [Danionella cerebrum]|uniref:tRNA (adenine(37)-N6)-methyltransferase n=1 Tax=Danionella cerebrum TaxID=2873325 RepID=A0A553PE57_9TELE|nr:hypothetical protein DNTS_033510 [Danionella translucida]
MSTQACCCAEQVRKLTQQTSVMRREIKNLRMQIDGFKRAHRNQMSTLHSLLANCKKREDGEQPLNKGPREINQLEQVPIGYIRSCFLVKNGTPRQPVVCSSSRASLKIEGSVFNNPEHSLSGLEHYSHIWIIFLFHKNGQMSCKAKVKPPRLNGQRVGVYSSRSPHRPNALGLTLAKLEGITGDTLHLSGIDIISGTPVLDIKPYIPDYDSPTTRLESSISEGKERALTAEPPIMDPDEQSKNSDAASEQSSKLNVCSLMPSDSSPSYQSSSSDLTDVLTEARNYLEHFTENSTQVMEPNACEGASVKSNSFTSANVRYGHEDYSTIAAWVRSPPIRKLDVRFTANAERELREFLSCDATDGTRPKFQFMKGPDEAVAAIQGILSADPRSVYRRRRCADRLFFFTLDTADITCWFDDAFAEVVRVRPV